MIGTKVTLDDMLRARDRRADLQDSMLREATQKSCVACLSLNIAGDIKRTPMSRMLFDRGVSEFDRLGFDVLDHIEIDEATGSEALWLLDEDAYEVKASLERIEDMDDMAAARLFDFDVIERGGAGGRFAPVKLSREAARKCLLCERPAAECARSRNHGLEAVRERTNSLLRSFCADTLANAAYDALIRELETTPKPGLIDMNNNGSHRDMDANLMRRSARALLPYFRDAVLAGMAGLGMNELRPRGREADLEMFEATGGVNTHQGLVYSMGLLLAGMGNRLESGTDYLEYATGLANEDADRSYGATAHAASGFPDALRCAESLAYYKRTSDPNAAAAFALIDSMAILDDTNLIRRGGLDGLDFVRSRAAEISSLPEDLRLQAIEEFDREMILRNLSPGGSADMLALACLIDKWKELSRNL